MKKYNYCTKLISIGTICLFLINSASIAMPVKAQNLTKATLSPEVQITHEILREKFYMKGCLLEEDAADNYIKKQITHEIKVYGGEEKWKEENVKIINLNDPSYKGLIKNRINLDNIILVSVAGLLNKIGQLAHVGLRGEHYDDTPVIYIDSFYFGDPLRIIQKHEIDEVLQWEDLRCNILNLKNRTAMRKWIKENVNSIGDDKEKLKGTPYEGCTSAKDIAKKIHDTSYSLKEVYNDIDFSTSIDYEYIYDLLTIYGYKMDEKSNNINISANISPVTSSEKEILYFLTNEFYQFLLDLCKNNKIATMRGGIDPELFQSIMKKANDIDPSMAVYLKAFLETLNKMILFEGVNEDDLEDSVIALNDNGFKKYGLTIDLEPVIFRESPDEKPWITSLDYKIYRIKTIHSARNPKVDEGKINVYVLDEISTDFSTEKGGMPALFPTEKSGHMIKDMESLTAKETGLAGPKVYLRKISEEISSLKERLDYEQGTAEAILADCIHKYYGTENDASLLIPEEKRVAAHEVGHVYAFLEIDENLSEEEDEFFAYLYALMENLPGLKAYLSKLMLKTIQDEKSGIASFDLATGEIILSPSFVALEELKKKLKETLGISGSSDLELAKKIASLDEEKIAYCIRQIFERSLKRELPEIEWIEASSVQTQPLDLSISRTDKENHIQSIHEGTDGLRALATQSDYFHTASSYNYHYRSGTFRSYRWYLSQLEKLEEDDLLNDLTQFVRNLSSSNRDFAMFSVRNKNGSLGIGLRNSILEGEPLIVTSRSDPYGWGVFSIWVGHELFEYLTRRNCREDLSDVDIFVLSELIWQEILRHYFREADQKTIDRLKEYAEEEAEKEREYQKKLTPYIREALNTSSGWDEELGDDEIYIRALARKITGTRTFEKFVGWREIGQSLFEDVLMDTIFANLESKVDSEHLSSADLIPNAGELNANRLLPNIDKTHGQAFSKPIAESILSEATERGILVKSGNTYTLSQENGIEVSAGLTEDDKTLLRYFLSIQGILNSEGVEREYRLIGTALPEPIGRAVAFLEVAFFPPVGAGFTGSILKGFGESSGPVGSVHVFSPNVSFSFRGRTRGANYYEITITPVDDPDNSKVTTVKIPENASFEETLLRVIMALPSAPKSLFCETSINGFLSLADKLCIIPKETQITILKEFKHYISLHLQQGAFNDMLPRGTGSIPVPALASEIGFIAEKDPQKRAGAKMALESLQEVFGDNDTLATVLNNLPAPDADKSTKLLTQGNSGMKGVLKTLKELLPIELEKNRYYVIRYDKKRLQEYQIDAQISKDFSPEVLLKTYVMEMQKRAQSPDQIKLAPYYGDKSDNKGLISVRCYKERTKITSTLIGEGTVDFKSKNIKRKDVKILDLLNIAFAASNIRKNITYKEYNPYEKELLSFIQDQCKVITGNIIPLEKILNYIRQLPSARPLPIQDIEKHFRLTIEKLKQAA